MAYLEKRMSRRRISPDGKRHLGCFAKRLIPIVADADSGDSQKRTNLDPWRKQEVCDGFSAFFAVGFRWVHATALARQTRNADQARRLFSLASIYDGGLRADAARLGSVTVQIVRDRVIRFNARGPD